MPVINFKSPTRKVPKISSQNILVRDYMSKEVITFHKSDSIFEAKRIMLEKKISGAPIINKSGKLILGSILPKENLPLDELDALANRATS